MSVLWAELREGQGAPAPLRIGPVTRTDFVRYQGASGDMNPVHHDKVFARAAGYPAPLGVGMFHAGVMSSYATDWLGPQNLRRVKLRWSQPVWPGDVLTFSAEIVRKYEERGERLVEVALTCERRGEGVEPGVASTGVAATGRCTFVVPE